MQARRCVVPEGMTVGDKFTVDVPKIGRMTVVVPNGHKPGSRFNFQVPVDKMMDRHMQMVHGQMLVCAHMRSW